MMLRSLAWKEAREQSSVWVAVAVLAGVLVYTIDAMARSNLSSPGSEALVIVVGLGMMVVYAFTCGGMLLAGERETHTMWFLDCLTRRRWNLWTTKVGIAAVLTTLQAVVLALMTSQVLPAELIPTGVWWMLIGLVAFESLAWGLFASAMSRTVLGTVLLATPMLGLVWVFTAPVMFSLRRPVDIGVAILGLRVAAAVLALAGSSLIFCAPDRSRRHNVARARARPRGRMSSVLVMLWLYWRQGRIAVLILLGLSLPMCLLSGSAGLSSWAVYAFAVGAICGFMMFAPEQGEQAQRFLGDQRLPWRYLWTGRLLAWGTTAFLLTLGSALIILVIAIGQRESNRGDMPGLLRDIYWLRVTGIGTYFWLWASCAFGVSAFFAMCFRKTAVGLAIAVTVSASHVMLWTPSLLHGGLHYWQFLLPTGILLISTLVCMRAWVSERVGALRTVLVLIAGGLLACTSAAAGLWYRVAEVPAAPAPFDVQAFVSTFPKPEDNEAGRGIKQALRTFNERYQTVQEKLGPLVALGGPGTPGDGAMGGAAGDMGAGGEAPGGMGVGMMGGPPGFGIPFMPPLKDDDRVPQMPGLREGGEAPPQGGGFGGAAGFAPGQENQPTSYYDMMHAVITGNVTKPGPKFEQWLSAMGDSPWVEEFQQAVRQPLGLIDDARNMNASSLMPSLQELRTLSLTLLTLALKHQQDGDSRKALEEIGAVLALTRHMRHLSAPIYAAVAVGIEEEAFNALDRWGSRLPGKDPLFAEALALIHQQQDETPSILENFYVEYLIQQNSAAGQFYIEGPTGISAEMQNSLRETSLVPWEKERRRRMLDAVMGGYLRWLESNLGLAARPMAQLPQRVLGREWLAPDGSDSHDQAEWINELVADSSLRWQIYAPTNLVEIVRKHERLLQNIENAMKRYRDGRDDDGAAP